MNVSIGLDIGIASVGWSVIDSRTGRIDDLGVRLFEARNSDNNDTRRKRRGGRRLIRRRVTRLKDAKNYLESKGFHKDKSLNHISPYALRVKGLDEQLTKEEIYKVITHIVKKRGISYLEDDGEGAKENGKDYTHQLNKNSYLLKEYTPGQIQYRRLKENGRVRTGINQQGNYQLNVFTVDAYARELRRILNTQQAYYSEINDEFINFFLKKGLGKEAGLIYRKRPYYHGPGNENNPSQYGRWANYEEDGYPAENIFDQLIGKDIQGYLRASSAGKSAQIYNLLNDLNNLRLPRENQSITVEEKKDILEKLMEGDIKQFGPRQLAKELGYQVNEIKGWRLNKNNKPEIHNLSVYRKWQTIFKEAGLDLSKMLDQDIDSLAMIITLNTEKDAVSRTLAVKLPHFDQEMKDFILDNFDQLKKAAGTAKWHSFSVETLNALIPELLNTGDEQNTILERMGLKFDLRSKYSNLKHIPVDEILNEIYNPTVSKSVRQTVKVLNALVDRYGKENISHVTIEMPRDKNEDDRRNIIKEIQKTNENRKTKSKEYFLTKSGWSQDRFENELRRPAFAKKLHYYFEQDGKCAYSGQAIQPEDLLMNNTEIDHIIPLSISLDDSLNNKVLVLAEANQEKGQRTPFQAFDEGAKLGQSKEEYISWVKANKSYKKYKRNLLLFDDDIFKPQVQKRFVARNLNDTRYSSRVVLNAVNSFFYQSQTKVKVVTGSFTHTLRKKWGNALEKTRETHHHHAIDATLCAVAPFVTISSYEYHYDKEDGSHWMVDTLTGERISYRDYKTMKVDERRSYLPQWETFIPNLYPDKLYSRIKFSHQVDRKANREISDVNPFSTRTRTTHKITRGKEKIVQQEMIIGKIEDIYTAEGYKKYKTHKDDLLIKEKDIQSFKILEEIAKTYPDFRETQESNGKIKREEVSPFKVYIDDNNLAGIQKYSKKGNGPIIRQLKYYDKKLGSHINITKGSDGERLEETKNGKKAVLLQLNPWRTDVYYDSKKGQYKLLGIKYNHLKYKNGNYGVDDILYNELKEKEDILASDEFLFSIYKKERILFKKEDECIEGIFHSRTLENKKNYFEMKPLDKSKWDSNEELPIFGKVAKGGRFIKNINKSDLIVKVNTSVLGEKYYVKKESFKGVIKE